MGQPVLYPWNHTLPCREEDRARGPLPISLPKSWEAVGAAGELGCPVGEAPHAPPHPCIPPPLPPAP